jgi:hypothetical protein
MSFLSQQGLWGDLFRGRLTARTKVHGCRNIQAKYRAENSIASGLI